MIPSIIENLDRLAKVASKTADANEAGTITNAEAYDLLAPIYAAERDLIRALTVEPARTLDEAASKADRLARIVADEVWEDEVGALAVSVAADVRAFATPPTPALVTPGSGPDLRVVGGAEVGHG